jgi:hypothetical protein
MPGVCQSVRTDGNPAIPEENLKFVVRVSTEMPHIAMTICMFYPYVRMEKTLPTVLKDILYITDNVVIFIRVRALNLSLFLRRNWCKTRYPYLSCLMVRCLFRGRIRIRVSQMGE